MTKYENRSVNMFSGDYEERKLDVENIEFSNERAKRVDHFLHTDDSDALVQHQVRATNVNFNSPHSDKDSKSERLLSQAIQGEYSYGKLGLILGLSSIIGGVLLGLNGVVGSTSWTASVLGLKSEINDAAPGVVLFIVGLFMIWVTKPNVKMKNLRG